MNRASINRFAIAAAESVSDVLARETSALDELDAVTGDGDHGTKISHGAAAALHAVQSLDHTEASAADLLRAAGRGFGSAEGTANVLWATLLEALAARMQRGETIADFSAALTEAVGVMAATANVSAGDKTILDTLQPASAVFSEALREGDSALDAWWRATGVAEEAAQETAAIDSPLSPGDDQGFPDAGAASCALIVSAIYEVLVER